MLLLLLLSGVSDTHFPLLEEWLGSDLHFVLFTPFMQVHSSLIFDC